MEANSSLKRKHVEIQDVPKRKGLFQEGSYPEHFYPIGENYFILASLYQTKAAIHIRKFNRYGDNYYPSTAGLTLQPDQFNVCFSNDAPTSIFDICDINMRLEAVNPDNKREFYLLMAEDGRISLTRETTCRSGRVYKWPLDITHAQWHAIRRVYENVISSYITLKYKHRDFLKTFKMVSKRILPMEKPNSARYEEAEGDMNRCFAIVLYKHIGEKKGLSPPMRICDEEIEISDLVSIRDFNESCMYLNVVALARDFELELVDNHKLFPDQEPLIDFLSENYLKNIRLDECIAAARKDFCSYDF